MKPKGKKVKSTQQLSQEMPIFIQNRNNPFFSGKKEMKILKIVLGIGKNGRRNSNMVVIKISLYILE